MASLTSLQRIVLGIGIIAFVTLGLFPPWDSNQFEAPLLMKETGITEWPAQPAGRHLIFFPPGGLDPRLAMDRLVVEWLVVVALTVGSILILKQNQTSRT